MRTSNCQAIAAERPAAVSRADRLSVRDYKSTDDAQSAGITRLVIWLVVLRLIKMWVVKDFGNRARRPPPEVRDHARPERKRG